MLIQQLFTYLLQILILGFVWHAASSPNPLEYDRIKGALALDPKLVEPERAFRLTDPQKPGYCQPWNPAVRHMVQDAFALAQSALMGLLIVARGTFSDNEMDTINAHEITVQTTNNLLGIHSEYQDDSDSYKVVRGKTHFNPVWGTYYKIMRALHNRSFILTCGDGQWKWVRTFGEANIQPQAGQTKDTPIAEMIGEDPNERRWMGIWYNAQLNIVEYAEPENINDDGSHKYGSICAEAVDPGGKTAARYIGNGVILICDGTLKDEINLDTMRVKASRAQRFESIESFARFPGSILTHELAHAVDPEILDQPINPISMDLDESEDDGEDDYGNGMKRLAYNMQQCMDLVNVDGQNLAIKNAANYEHYPTVLSLIPDDFNEGFKSNRPRR